MIADALRDVQRFRSQWTRTFCSTMMPGMADTATDANRPAGSPDRSRTTVWEGLAVLSAGLGLAPHIWWVGFLFAAWGLYLVMWSRLRPSPEVDQLHLGGREAQRRM